MRRGLTIVAFTLAGLFGAVTASAQATLTWTGAAGPTGGNIYAFENPANWSGNVAPVNGDHLVFGALPSISVYLTTNFTAGNITFSGIQNGLYLVGTATLTLNGNVTTTSGSAYWGLFSLPVDLSAGNHTYTENGTADIYHFGAISGTGGIIQNGPNNLILAAASTYSGGTVVNGGILFVGSDNALGSGTVTVNGGTLATSYTDSESGGVFLPNNFLLGANPKFGSYLSDSKPLTLGGNENGNYLRPLTGVTTVNFDLLGTDPLYIDGALQDGAAATTYTFANETTSPGYILTGNNSHTGGTVVVNGSSVVFQYAGAIPASGQITVQANAYAGLGDNSVTPTAFLGHFNPTASAGTIGFDEDLVYAGAINLSGFSDPNLSIGTHSSATLTGVITPVTGSGVYNFRGSGFLRLADAGSANPLTGSNDLVARSFPDRSPLMLVLQPTGTNNYTGDTLADGAGIVFDAAGALSASTSIDLANGGYVSVTDTSGLTLANLIGKIGSVSNGGVLGLDSSTYLNGGGGSFTDSNPINFGSLTQDVYLGSASTATFSGTITTANSGAGDYYLTGYNSNTLTISSVLAGSGKVLHVGLPGVYQIVNNIFANVVLSSAGNTYTGGTVLHSGQLQIATEAALGSGILTVDAGSNSDSSASLFVTSAGNFTKNIALSTGNLYLYGSSVNYTGAVSGAGSLYVNGDITLSGNNSYSGGTTLDQGDVLIAASNTALGTGGVALFDGGQVTFTTATPGIGSLLEGTTFDNGDGTVISASLVIAPSTAATLTINQAEDRYFDGAIVQGAGVGSVTKIGSGTLTISGYIGEDNAYTTPYSGGTSIVAGTLIADSATALGTGTITLNGGRLGVSPGVTLANPIAFGASGGVLSGNATFSSAIAVGANAKLSPGDSPGTMTFSSGLTLASGGQLDFEVQSAGGAAGTGYDLISISAGLLDVTATSGSKFTIKLISLNSGGSAGNVSDFSSGNSYSWMLFQGNSGSGINGFDPTKFALDTSSFSNGLGGGTFSLLQGTSGGNPVIFLNFAPVPEPSTYALLALGLAGVALRARRRHG